MTRDGSKFAPIAEVTVSWFNSNYNHPGDRIDAYPLGPTRIWSRYVMPATPKRGVSFAHRTTKRRWSDQSPKPTTYERRCWFAYSTALIRRNAVSVAKIEHPEVMDETTRKPKTGGLMNPRMGTIITNFKYQTLVSHPGFIMKVKEVLETVFANCGKLKDDIARMAVVWRHCKTKVVCSTDEPEGKGAEGEGEEPKKGHGGCGHIQPLIRKEGLKMFVQYKETKYEMKSLQPDKRQTPSEIYTVFKTISDHDLHLLGLSDECARTEWIILTVLPVPPPPVRLSIAVDGGAMRSEDDLTYKLGDILKASANTRRCEQEAMFHTATYMDNDISEIPPALQKSGRPVKAICARLKGKEGRLRGKLTGKRVDFSARTIITSDLDLELDEVGVPRSIAMNLAFPERATPYNIGHRQQLVRNGPTTHPGARCAIRDTGERIDLRYNKRADSEQSTYNTDFDGDEMNMHVPRAKRRQIAWVPRQIISPQANKPVMGIVQDTLCGIRKFTLRNCSMDWNAVQNVLLWVPDWDGTVPIPAILKPGPLWAGKQILSMATPKGINIHRAPDPRSSNPVFHDGALIGNGELIIGIVEKEMIGASQGHGGPEVTKTLFTGLQMVVNYWLSHNGFSIGIGDAIADANTMSHITKMTSESKAKVAVVIEEAMQDKLKMKPGMTPRESFESSVETYTQKHLKEDNNVKQMVSVEGKRITFGFRHRSLHHFTKGDFSPESRGFVEDSYLRCLIPQELFFHAMASREGLIDTAVKTAETGYVQRRLVKALEDVMVCYDGTVHSSLGDFIQFVYGEDSMDGAFSEKQSIETFTLHNAEFQHKYRVDVTDPAGGFMAGVLQVGVNDSPTVLQEKLDQEFAKKDRHDLRHFISPRTSTTVSFYLNANLYRIVQNAIQIFHIDRRKPSNLEPTYTVREAQEGATLMFKLHLRPAFAGGRVLEQYHLAKEAFEWVLGEVEARFNQSFIHPGETCGTLAAQYIGEPATQMSPNSFHYSGVPGKNVTLDVPRLKEVINAATNIKTPSLTIHLEPQIATAAALAKNPFVEYLLAIPDEDIESKLLLQSLWLLPLVLNRSKVPDRKLTMQYVTSNIVEYFKSDLRHLNLIICCRVLGRSEKAEGGMERTMLNSVNLLSVKGINRVLLTPSERVIIDGEDAIPKQKDEEWTLETDGANLKAVLTVDSVDASRTYSSNCVEVVNVLALMRCSFEEIVEILTETVAVGEKYDCLGNSIANNVGQIAPMGTGAFEVALDIDMLVAAIVDHRLPVQSMLAAQIDTPRQRQDGLFQDNPMSSAFSPTPSTRAEDAANLQYSASPQPGQSPGSPGYSFSSPSSPYSPSSPGFALGSPFGAAPTSPYAGYATSSPYDRPRPWAASPTYSANSPALNLGDIHLSYQLLRTSPRYSPQSPWFNPTSAGYSPTSPSFSPTSPKYSPSSPRFPPTSPSYSTSSPVAFRKLSAIPILGYLNRI
ncbi:beta and beta-prime subunits of DNA dependent RNA-polymerase [Coprinellus micaceus]|uniref:DNA-directed RNA polymerase subunit n=1 Tax=Coprinellus micaceus TaxID=71717 RepID=A0A4Y7TED8_COPMI|nr:beta and beta-prime subunits of DNA dependent RNA-polymerase [Coprinellus micaceus]